MPVDIVESHASGPRILQEIRQCIVDRKFLYDTVEIATEQRNNRLIYLDEFLHLIV